MLGQHHESAFVRPDKHSYLEWCWQGTLEKGRGYIWMLYESIPFDLSYKFHLSSKQPGLVIPQQKRLMSPQCLMNKGLDNAHLELSSTKSFTAI